MRTFTPAPTTALQRAYRVAVLSRSGDAPRVVPPLVTYLRAQQKLGTIKARRCG